MTAKSLQIKVSNQIVYLILSRPKQRNAFDQKMILEITKAFAAISKKKNIKAVLMSGAGESFCAGADLKWMKASTKLTKAQNTREASQLFDMFNAVKNCPVPVITKVHGHVMGGGLGLMAASDIAVAEHDTKFAFSEVKLGLIPAVISSFALAKGSYTLVSELMLTGEVFQATRAREAGLVNYCGRELELRAYLDNVLKSLNLAGPEAVRKTKALLLKVKNLPANQVKSFTTEAIASVRTGKEAQAGLKAFLEKKKAPWAPSDESKN